MTIYNQRVHHRHMREITSLGHEQQEWVTELGEKILTYYDIIRYLGEILILLGTITFGRLELKHC